MNYIAASIDGDKYFLKFGLPFIESLVNIYTDRRILVFHSNISEDLIGLCSKAYPQIKLIRIPHQEAEKISRSCQTKSNPYSNNSEVKSENYKKDWSFIASKKIINWAYIIDYIYSADKNPGGCIFLDADIIAVKKCENLFGFDIGLTTYGCTYPVAWGNEALCKSTGIEGVKTGYRINSGFMYVNLQNLSTQKFMHLYIKNTSSLFHLETSDLMYGAHDQDGLIKTVYGTRYPGKINEINNTISRKMDDDNNNLIIKWLACNKFNQPEPCDTLLKDCYFLHLKGAWSRILPDRILSRKFAGNIRHKYCSEILKLYCHHYDNAVKKFNMMC